MKTSAALLIVPVSIFLMGCGSSKKEGYYLQNDPTRSGFLVRVVNNTKSALRCYLEAKGQEAYLIVRAGRTSESYFFRVIPKLRCVHR